MKFHGDEVTDFFNKESPKVDSKHTCLAVISLKCALKSALQFLRECRYM